MGAAAGDGGDEEVDMRHGVEAFDEGGGELAGGLGVVGVGGQGAAAGFVGEGVDGEAIAGEDFDAGAVEMGGEDGADAALEEEDGAAGGGTKARLD